MKNLPVTPLPTVKLDKQQETLLEHNRLLGTLLGETIFTYAGLHIFKVTESLREASISYYKTNKQESRKDLSLFCSELGDSEILRVIRGFTYFSVPAQKYEIFKQNRNGNTGKISGKS